VKREGKEEVRKEDEYQGDAHLMDIYSFPGYQVEIKVPTNPDVSSKQVILDAAIRGEVDPVVLGEAGSPYTRSRRRGSSSRWMTGSTWRI
jgi:hypothetical protein